MARFLLPRWRAVRAERGRLRLLPPEPVGVWLRLRELRVVGVLDLLAQARRSLFTRGVEATEIEDWLARSVRSRSTSGLCRLAGACADTRVPGSVVDSCGPGPPGPGADPEPPPCES